MPLFSENATRAQGAVILKRFMQMFVWAGPPTDEEWVLTFNDEFFVSLYNNQINILLINHYLNKVKLLEIKNILYQFINMIQQQVI